MSTKKWAGSAEELKGQVSDGLMEENSGEFNELVSQDGIGALSCETSIVGTCERGGKTGQKIKYTCHYPDGKPYSFYVCDIS